MSAASLIPEELHAKNMRSREDESFDKLMQSIIQVLSKRKFPAYVSCVEFEAGNPFRPDYDSKLRAFQEKHNTDKSELQYDFKVIHKGRDELHKAGFETHLTGYDLIRVSLPVDDRKS